MQDNYDNHPLDLSYLTEMVGQNLEFLIEIFDTFIEKTPFDVAELEHALFLKKWNKVADCLHKIKPTFSYIGRADLHNFVKSIEYNAKNKVAVKQIPADIKQLKILITQIYAQLEVAKKDIQAKL